MATSSQRLSFTQLVLDMGLADKKGLRKAKAAIKEAKADGRKLTVARACVDLEILSEKEAKKVQRELKRLKQGFASSEAFHPEGVDPAVAEKKRERKRRKSQTAEKPKAKKSATGKVEEAKKKKAKKSEAEGAVEAEAEEDEPKAKKKRRKKSGEADAPVAKKKGQKKKPSDEAAVEEDEEEAEVVGAPVEGSDEDTSEAPSEDSEAPSEEEEEAPKAKKKGKSATGKVARGKSATGKVARGKSGTGKVGRKASVGKEIPLESQRTAAVEDEPTKKGKKPRARRDRRGLAEAGEAPGSGRKSNAPVIAIVSAVIVLLVIAVAIAMKPKDGPKAAKITPKPVEIVPEGDQPDGPPADRPKGPKRVKPKDRSEWTPKERAREAIRMAEKLVVEASDLADEGKVEAAIKKLEGFPEDLKAQTAYTEDVAPYLSKLKKVAPEKKRLDAGLAASEKEMLEVFASTFEEDYEFHREGFVVAFHEAVREKLGDARYEEEKDNIARDFDPDDYETEEDYDVEFTKDLEVETRGNEARHKALVSKRGEFENSLSAAQGRLRATKETARKKLSAQAQRAIKGGAKLKTDKGQPCKVVDLTETGFVVEINGSRVEFGWGAAPPKLGHKVRSLSIDNNDADEVYDLGIYALKMGQFDAAKRDFARAAKLGSKRPVPDIDSLATLVDVFRGSHDYTPGKTGTVSVAWKLRDKKEAQDFTPLHEAMKHDVSAGGLSIKTPNQFLLTAVRVQGSWSEEVTFTAKLGPTNVKPAIWFESEGGQFYVEFGPKTLLYSSFLGKGAPTSTSDVSAKQGDEVKVTVREKSKTKFSVTVQVRGEECFSTDVAGEGGIKFMVGRKGSGDVRFGELSVKGTLDSKWVRKVNASAPGRLARELGKFEAKGENEQMALPAVMAITSAEDDVALEGIPDSARQKLKNARVMFAQGNQYGAMKAIEEAASNPLFHAANYLYAALQVQRDPTGALIRLERADKGVQDFYEAKVARASALFWIGKYDEARKHLKAAMNLRPDYAPAYLVKANLQVNKGQYVEAIDTLALALELSPGDPFALRTRGQVVALAEGPAWVARKRATTSHYVLDTDMVDYADTMVQQLESIRKRYEEAYPILKTDEDHGAASVLIFREAEGYFSYSDRTGVGRVENTLGHFNPWSGQLLLFLEDDPDDWNSYHVIFHEGMHQWAHANGLELPFWANEGMAEYVGGTKLSDDGKKIVERGAIDSFLKKRLMNLTANWNQRLDFFDIAKQSPGEFYQGNAPLKYAQAWTMIHFFMESGYPEAKKRFFEYLAAYKALKSPEDKKSAQEGSKMQYIWNDTLGQLDPKPTKEAWEKYVQKLAKRAGLSWKRP
jgi:tetratricopeptide (TPR) repeat protein